jgi:hypothetical protein
LKTGWATGPGRSKGGIEPERVRRSRDRGIPVRFRPADCPEIAAAKTPTLVERTVVWTEKALPSIWADQWSRGCLIATVAFLWLSVALAEPVFLVPMAGAAFGLWKRREHRAAAAAEPTDPDFF